MQYLKSGPPQLHDMSSRLKDWLERSMMISMALDLSRAIWSSAVRSLREKVQVSQQDGLERQNAALRSK